MKVKKFNFHVNDEAGEAGRRWLTKTFQTNAKKLEDLDDILDATALTKSQALSSGLFSSIDGSLKWSVPKTESTERKWSQFISRRMPEKLITALTPICEKYGGKPKQPTSVEDLLPTHLETVRLNIIAEKAKRNFSFQAAVDSSSGTGVELSGFQPFIFNSDWIAQGSVKLNPFRSSGPNLEAKISRPLVVSKDEKTHLETLNLCARRRRETKRHLAHLVDSCTTEASCLFNNASENPSGSASIGLRHLNERQKSASIVSQATVPFFNRWTLFGTSKRNYTIGNGVVKTTVHIDVPLTRDISRGTLEYSTLWHGIKTINDYLTLTTRAGLATIWSRMGIDDIPLSRRLYLGGTTNEIPLRVFTANEVGGLISPSKPRIGLPTKAEHLGGTFRLNGSLELSANDPLRKVHLPARVPAGVIESARKISPFLFTDAGVLLPKIPYNPIPVQSLRISAGVGLSCPIGQVGLIKLTAGKVMRDNFQEASTSCFNVSLSSRIE